MPTQYSNHNQHIRVSPSAVAELNAVFYQLLKDASVPKYAHPWREHIDSKRADLVQRVRALHKTDHFIPLGLEMLWVAGRFGYLPGDDPEPFFARFGDLVAAVIKDKATLTSARDMTTEEAAARMQFFRKLADPALHEQYVELWRELWNELAPIWERDGLPVVQLECTRLRQRLDEGADLLELLPPQHFLQFDEPAAIVRRALEQHGSIVVTPLHFASGGYLMDTDVQQTPLFLGYSPHSEGIHRATLQRATNVATRLKAFSDPTRLTILATVVELDVTVGDLAKLLNITQPSVSGHLKVLQETGLVTVRKKGVKSFYRANPEAIASLIKEAEDLLK